VQLGARQPGSTSGCFVVRGNDEPLRVAQRQTGLNRRELRSRLIVGPVSTSRWRWLSKNPTGISLPVNADMSTGIQVHFVDEFDAHLFSQFAPHRSVIASAVSAAHFAVHPRIDEAWRDRPAEKEVIKP
jgi:hypothetical protein